MQVPEPDHQVAAGCLNGAAGAREPLPRGQPRKGIMWTQTLPVKQRLAIVAAWAQGLQLQGTSDLAWRADGGTSRREHRVRRLMCLESGPSSSNDVELSEPRPTNYNIYKSTTVSRNQKSETRICTQLAIERRVVPARCSAALSSLLHR
jgi:hypothetical protein